MTTYTGKLLRIDLNSKTHREEIIPAAYYENFLSARGLGAKYLFDELPPNIDPLGPENKIIMLIGLLGGTGLQGFSKWAVMCKSPLTGTITRSYSGGNFGVWLKFAGFDMMIIEGKAENLTYIYMDQKNILFIPADNIAGLDPRSVQEKLKKKHGRKTESACIGLAGEKLVRYAVITSGERTASRGGVGTVMGSKNLKAIAINTQVRKQKPYDSERFDELVKEQIRILKEHPRKKSMNTIGTPYITVPLMKNGVLPVRNFQNGTIDNIQSIDGDSFYHLKEQKAGCYSCMTRCGGMRHVSSGPLKNQKIDGPEYESIFSLGTSLGITDKQFIIDANAICDFFGIDTISAGVCISFLCELFEKKLISSELIDHMNISWGNKEVFFSLLEKIGKRQGIGKILGEGVKRASEFLGEETKKYAIHIKGLELPGYEPRAVKGYALSMATSNIGGSHMYGRPRAELSGLTDPFTETGKGKSIAHVQIEQAIEDSLIACTFGNSGLDMDKYSDYLTAATGIKAFSDPINLLKIGERIICLERCFNIREGFARKDDTLPIRMLSEPLENAGPATGQIVGNLDELLDEYYDALCYTEDGLPSVDKLRELKLNDAIEKISPFMKKSLE